MAYIKEILVVLDEEHSDNSDYVGFVQHVFGHIILGRQKQRPKHHSNVVQGHLVAVRMLHHSRQKLAQVLSQALVVVGQRGQQSTEVLRLQLSLGS